MSDRAYMHHVAALQEHLASERLSDYATAFVLGQDDQAQFADVVAHLTTCEECQVDLDDLLEIVEATYAEAIEPAQAYPQAKLAFLDLPAQAPPAVVSPWLVAAGRLIVQFSEALLSALRQPALAGAARGALLYRYVQEPGSVADLDVAVEVYAEDSARRQGLVRVSVDVPSRGSFDQTGSTVVLYAGESSWRGETDDAGTIDFAHVPLDALPRLRVEIVPFRAC